MRMEGFLGIEWFRVKGCKTLGDVGGWVWVREFRAEAFSIQVQGGFRAVGLMDSGFRGCKTRVPSSGW